MTKLLVGRVSSTRSKTMAAIKSKNSKAELRLRECLSALGLRYRLHRRGLPGSPDIVFSRRKVAVFCDGDFWHGELKKRLKPIHTRRKYWVRKIDSNIARDKRNNRDLKSLRWKVLRFWETDILRDGERIAGRVQKALEERSSL